MNVYLFDTLVGGHHQEYAGHIARYLTREGDKVTFITSSGARSLLDEERDFARVLYLRERSNARGVLAWYLSTFHDVQRGTRIACRDRAEVLHYLYLDRYEIPVLSSLLWRVRRPAVFGTMFWPYFDHGDQRIAVAKRLAHDANMLALGGMLAGGQMQRLFVHSDRIRSLLVARLPAAAAESIVVVPDPTKEAPPISAEQARSDLGLPAHTPILLFFGDTRREKGPDILLAALPRVDMEWVTVIAGDPVWLGEKECEACRRTLGRPDRLVSRLAFASELDADRLFRAADVVILPYRASFKGTSGVLRRAAASGKPVIAADVGDVGPVARAAGLGIVVPPESPQALADGIRAFLERKDEIQREVYPRAIEYAGANDWRILGEKVRATYTTVLRRPDRNDRSSRTPFGSHQESG